MTTLQQDEDNMKPAGPSKAVGISYSIAGEIM